ncbi:hypothetical protein RRG08_023820 [Elysia crispata]|uniref:G-protein coupled receptors family 1 profile domain-containing protein n=1 Tax=Elysia crispata TaxID=231223 RepID=A0AAE0ZVJ3_9GAST|nr:hypothetical protein RRG08_023820 [Elysia crispata]
MTIGDGNNSTNVSTAIRSEKELATSLGCADNDLYGSPAIGGVAVLIGIALMGENLLMISVICRYQALHTNTNILVASLAVSDVMIGFQCCIMGLMSWPNGMRSWIGLHEFELRVLYTLITGVNFGLIVVSMAHLAVLSLDRYLYVLWPLRYPRRVTQRRVIIMAIGIWTLGCIYMVLPLVLYLDPKYHVKCFLFETPMEYFGGPIVCVHFTCLTIVLTSTVGLARIALKHSQKRKECGDGVVLDSDNDKDSLTQVNEVCPETLAIAIIGSGDIPAAVLHTSTISKTESKTVSDIKQRKKILAIDTNEQFVFERTKYGSLKAMNKLSLPVCALNEYVESSEEYQAHTVSIKNAEIKSPGATSVNKLNLRLSHPRNVINCQLKADAKKKKTLLRRKKLKILKFVALIVGCYLVCSFPAIFIMIIDDIAQVYHFSNTTEQTSGLLLMTNSGMNFIIMAHFKTDFRSALSKFFLCVKCYNRKV